ncbi:MAG: signal recognition particle-docking protein FtsY [Desulfuromonas sp.]|nr:MAG: signal recognition particle-docking protein FtsY [Desulfuromonas sp.]
MQWSELMESVYQSWRSVGEFFSGVLVQMSQWLQQVIAWLVAHYAQWGVPAEQQLLAAYATIYLAATVLVLLLVWRLVRRRRQRGQKEKPTKVGEVGPGVVEEEGEAETVAEPSEEITAPVEEPAAPLSLYDRMRSGLAKTSSALVGRIDTLFTGASGVNQELLEELEEILITADCGMKTTQMLVDAFQKQAKENKVTDPEALRELLKAEIRALLNLNVAPLAVEGHAPFVLMVIGVNGVGKTTTIGKLAQQFTRQGKKVILGAADTFRAAAADQLEVWGERTGVTVIRHAEGADPAAVAFDAAKAAVARKADIMILDTAGRLHTKVNLMEEMKKLYRVLGREIDGAPHETMLVLDATTGQNALVQARLFQEAVGVTGIALTKLDGTAKGGMAVAIGAELGLPVRYVGIGEGVDDLRPFDPEMFVDALFEKR